MILRLYKSPGEDNLLNRSMTLIAEINTIDTPFPVDIETPELLISYSESYLEADYFYIPKYKRYYFRREITVENGFQIRLQLESDPLMSFRSGILGSPCIAKRSSSNINPELEDNQVAFKCVPKRIYRRMPGGFNPTANGGTYVLTLGGK